MGLLVILTKKSLTLYLYLSLIFSLLPAFYSYYFFCLPLFFHARDFASSTNLTFIIPSRGQIDCTSGFFQEKSLIILLFQLNPIYSLAIRQQTNSLLSHLNLAWPFTDQICIHAIKLLLSVMIKILQTILGRKQSYIHKSILFYFADSINPDAPPPAPNTATTKYIVNNPTTGKPSAEFPKLEGEPEMKQQQKIMTEGRHKWNALNIGQRKQNLRLFIEALQKSKQELIAIIQSATGRHKQYSTFQVEACLAMLKQDLSEKYPQAVQKDCGLYYFKAFGNILVVSDYRMVAITCLKYLISCGIAGNCLILKTHRYGLPIAKKIQQIWTATLPQFPLLYCPINNFADGLQYLVQKKDMGFVSFSGDIQAGNSFYHFMAQKSEILAQSQFLLTSSDSAYVLKDLSDEKLKKIVNNLADACFMAGGNLYTSVKRIYVDQQISQKFTSYFLEAANIYKISGEGSKASPTITSGHIELAKEQIKQLQQYKGPELKLLTSVETKQSYKSLYVSPLIYKVDGIASIEYWNKIYPLPICFIQSVASQNSAIQHINSSIYGISSTVYTGDKANIEKVGRPLDVGVVYGNRWGFYPGIPYSPRKRSGKGHSFSIHSFTNVVKSQSLKGYSELAQ